MSDTPDPAKAPRPTKPKSVVIEPSETPVVAVPKRGLGKKLAVLVPLALMPAGYFVGDKYLLGSPPVVEVEAEPAPAVPHSIDELILEGDYATALTHARAGQKSANVERQAALRFREALCLEALEQWSTAGEVFASLADRSAATSRDVAAALGLARCWLRVGRLDDARRVVARLILSSGSTALRDPALTVEIPFAKAALELSQMPAPPMPHPFQPDGLATTVRRPDLAKALEWAGTLHVAHEKHDAHAADKHDAPKPKTHDAHAPEKHETPKAHDAHAEPARLTIGPAMHPLQRPVSGRASATAVPAALAEMAATCGLTVQAQTGISERLANRVASVHVHNMPLADVLDALTEPYGVAWRIEANILLIEPESGDVARQRDRARRAATMALSISPDDHPWRSSLLIDLGLLDAQDGDWKSAGKWFGQVPTDGPIRPESAVAAFNGGLASLRVGDRSKAREQFMSAVDRDPAGPWAALCYWWIGRSHLDAAETDRASAAFQKALAAGETTPVGPAAILAMSVADCQVGEFAEAHARLKQNKSRLRAAELKPITAFLDAYARYREAERPAKTGEFDDLVYATLNIRDLPIGPALAELVGRANRELGFGRRMVEIFDTATKDLRGPLALRMMVEVGEFHVHDGETIKARDRFKVVAAADRGESGSKARVRLAEFSNASGHYEDALTFANQALVDGADRSAALIQMGRAYDGLKDFRAAAKCYSGQVPDSTSAARQDRPHEKPQHDQAASHERDRR